MKPTTPSNLKPIKSRDIDESDRPKLIIRVGLDGFLGAEIIAGESDAQAQLCQLWNALRPALEAELDRTLEDAESMATAQQEESRLP